MSRLPSLLITLGVVALVLSAWLYDQAHKQRSADEAICALTGGDCAASISWAPILGVVAAGVVAIVAGWRLTRS